MIELHQDLLKHSWFNKKLMVNWLSFQVCGVSCAICVTWVLSNKHFEYQTKPPEILTCSSWIKCSMMCFFPELCFQAVLFKYDVLLFNPTWGNDTSWRAYFSDGWFNHQVVFDLRCAPWMLLSRNSGISAPGKTWKKTDTNAMFYTQCDILCFFSFSMNIWYVYIYT